MSWWTYAEENRGTARFAIPKPVTNRERYTEKLLIYDDPKTSLVEKYESNVPALNINDQNGTIKSTTKQSKTNEINNPALKTFIIYTY